MVIFVPCSAEEGKPWSEWILRLCPQCKQPAIVGHGRRTKHPYDGPACGIRIRRGLCRHCCLSFTFLPVWSPPYARYGFPYRRETCDRYVELSSAEQAAPVLDRDSRMADATTVLRWVRRRILSAVSWAVVQVHTRCEPPTILAWDSSWWWRTLNLDRGSTHGPPVFGSVESPYQPAELSRTA